MRTLLILLLLLLLLGSLPVYPYSTSWGYGPSGGLGVVFIILVVLLFARRSRL